MSCRHKRNNVDFLVFDNFGFIEKAALDYDINKNFNLAAAKMK